MFKKILLIISITLTSYRLFAAPISIVAAENFYGELAKEIGGSQVVVKSIIDNPNADPHLFATSPATTKALSTAQIIIYNGAGYDAWMEQLLANIDTKKVILINVANLVQVKSGANPHLWYKPETFPALAKVLSSKISKLNPHLAPVMQVNLANFLAENHKVQLAIKDVAKQYQGTWVTATEPVFGYLAIAMGLEMKGLDFQWKIMNETEPTPRMIAEYQDLLNKKQVKVLFYNNQVTDNITTNMQNLALKNSIPIVGVTETMPKDTTVNKWLLNEVNLTKAALNKSRLK